MLNDLNRGYNANILRKLNIYAFFKRKVSILSKKWENFQSKVIIKKDMT